jgi:O-antigen/teichoic acid export membrane protein
MEIRGYTREFYSYCSPLFVLALGGLVLGIFDRWILQRYAGSVQQGFFAFSYQLGAACFIFTVSMTPLITRDFSISFAKKDMEGMARAFRRYIPLFYAISAFLCCFLSVQAGNIISIFGGKSYAQALLAIQIMAFYPIHQTYGQLSGAVFYATGQTRLYRNIGLLFGIIGIPLTIFLLNPTFGINAGAAGLAVKMVVLQFIAVNIQLYFNARLLKLPFLKYIAHQVLSIGVLFSLSLLCAILINIATLNTLIRFLSEGILYALLVGIVVYFWPALFGMKSEDIFNLKKSARNYILKRSVK